MNKKVVLNTIAAVLICGCNEIEEMLTFSVNDSTNIRIESASPLNLPLEIPTPAVTSNSSQEFENNNTRADLVRDVKLQQLKVTITQPSGKSFSFLKNIRIFISADEQSEIELASLDNISTNTGVIELIPTQEKLDEFIKASTYDLRTQVTTDETLTQDVDARVDLKFQVTADTF